MSKDTITITSIGDCAICYDTIKPSKRIKNYIACPNGKCDAVYHTNCFMKGIESSSGTIKCFTCDKEMNEKFMYQSLGPTNKDKYRKYMASKDLEKEKNLLPSAQLFLTELKRAEKLEIEAANVDREIKRLKLLAGQYRSEAYRIRNGSQKVTKERATFICPCPSKDCKGFLNTKYFCTLCDTKVCSHCRADITGKEEEHKCNEDDVKSADLIKRITKPCPECGVRIHRPSGCDHMFCTAPDCNTSWSWSTGRKIDESKNTNEYYYAWKRKQPGGLAPVNVNCRATAENVFRSLTYYRDIMRDKKFYYLLRKLHHIISIDIPKFRQNPFEANRDLALKYLTDEYDEKDWSRELKKRRKKSVIYTELHKILEAYVESSADMLREYIALSPRQISIGLPEAKLAQLRKLQSSLYLRITKLRDILQKEINNMFEVFDSKMTFSIIV